MATGKGNSKARGERRGGIRLGRQDNPPVRAALRRPSAETLLIGIECLQWCANNAVYFLGLIGAATYDLAGSAYLVAGITLVRNLATSVGNAASGSVIDAIGPRRTTLGVCAFSVVACLVFGLIPLTVPGLIAAAACLGLSGGFINTCTHAYPAYLVSTQTGRQRLNGRMVFYSNIAYTLGPIVGGVLVSVFRTQAVYLFMAVMMAAAGALALECHEVIMPDIDPDANKGVLRGMVEGARLTLGSHDLRLIFISGFLGFFAFGAFDSLESLFYRDVLRVDIVWLGWLSSVVGLTSSVGAWLLTKLPDRMANMRLLMGSLLAVGVGSMVYVGTDMLGVAIAGQAINGLAWGFLEPLQMILVQEKAPMAYLGRVVGFVRFGLMSAGVLPLLVAPFLADVLGVQPVLFGASCIIAAVGAVFFARSRGRSASSAS